MLSLFPVSSLLLLAAPVHKLLIFVSLSYSLLQPLQTFLNQKRMVGCNVNVKKNADWVKTLLNSTFFGSCDHHQDLRKNEKNVFCIDCKFGFCRHCMNLHRLHQQLQICKYVYHDVVRLQDLQKYFDCSKIQTYKINGEKAVHLNTRSQSKDSKPSTKAKFGSSCEVCKRYLQDLPNSYCSVECKVSEFSSKPKDQAKEIIPLPIQEFPGLSLKEDNNLEMLSTDTESSLSLTDTSGETRGQMRSLLKPRERLRKRKGFPLRAPLS